jgi:hypothetical protein
MRKFIGLAACLLLAASMFLPSPAQAGRVKLSGTHSASEIKSKCDASGGDYIQPDSNHYSCVGPGGQVTCTSGKCNGTCPSCGHSSASINRVLPPRGQKPVGVSTGHSGSSKPKPHPVASQGVKSVNGGGASPGVEHHATSSKKH